MLFYLAQTKLFKFPTHLHFFPLFDLNMKFLVNSILSLAVLKSSKSQKSPKLDKIISFSKMLSIIGGKVHQIYCVGGYIKNEKFSLVIFISSIVQFLVVSLFWQKSENIVGNEAKSMMKVAQSSK